MVWRRMNIRKKSDDDSKNKDFVRKNHTKKRMNLKLKRRFSEGGTKDKTQFG